MQVGYRHDARRSSGAARVLKQKTGFPSSAANDYAKGIRDLVRGLWGGKIAMFSFVDGMIGAIRRGFTIAWYEGASACNIKPSELTAEEINRLNQEIVVEQNFVLSFAQDIWTGRKETGGKLGPLLERAKMWGDRYGSIRDLAMAMACGDVKKKWVWNPLKEHCTDCMRLNGRVYRLSTWNKYNIRPKSRLLACRGYRCGCEWVDTIEPCTPGRPPQIAGGI